MHSSLESTQNNDLSPAGKGVSPYLRTYTNIYLHVSYTYVYRHILIRAFIHIDMYTYMCVSTYICLCMCIYIYIYICMAHSYGPATPSEVLKTILRPPVTGPESGETDEMPSRGSKRTGKAWQGVQTEQPSQSFQNLTHAGMCMYI